MLARAEATISRRQPDARRRHVTPSITESAELRFGRRRPPNPRFPSFISRRGKTVRRLSRHANRTRRHGKLVRARAVCVRRRSRCPLSPRNSATFSAPRSALTVGRGLLPGQAAGLVGFMALLTARSSAPWCTPCAASGAGVAVAAWGPTTLRTGRSPAEPPFQSPGRRRGSRHMAHMCGPRAPVNGNPGRTAYPSGRVGRAVLGRSGLEATL